MPQENSQRDLDSITGVLVFCRLLGLLSCSWLWVLAPSWIPRLIRLFNPDFLSSPAPVENTPPTEVNQGSLERLEREVRTAFHQPSAKSVPPPRMSRTSLKSPRRFDLN